MRARQSIIVLCGILVGMVGSTWVAIRAQVQPEPIARPRPISQAIPSETRAEIPPAGSAGLPTAKSVEPAKPGGVVEIREVTPRSPEPEAGGSIQSAMLRIYRLPFARPITLEDLRAHLKKTLNVAVVLDVAALDRQDLKPDDTVQLELEGVRLKTGLQLLLDQVGLTFGVIPDDNLLVITDKEGSDDPLARVWAEIRELHRDIHEVQDSIDELTDLLVPEGADLRMHKPTIIEEMPEAQDPKEKMEPGGEKPGPTTRPPSTDSQPGPRSGGRIKPALPGTNTPPSNDPPGRLPLGRPRKRA